MRRKKKTNLASIIFCQSPSVSRGLALQTFSQINRLLFFPLVHFFTHTHLVQKTFPTNQTVGESFFCSMAPHKKSKKRKRELKKLKKRKIESSTVPVEPKAIESYWWETFWQKNSSTAGFILLSLALFCSV